MPSMAISERPRILVGTLYCGENEFSALRQSLAEQSYSRWEHVVFENLPNKEAHDRLYQTFMDERDRFDLFLKLDADMVFRSDEGLRRIVEVFDEHAELDHLTLAVQDWYSDSLIEGLHTFSDRASWPVRSDSRFVDASPAVPGERLKLWDHPAPVVDHSPNPSPGQAFRFGAHRALKVVQPERWSMRYGQTRGQWRILKRCWGHFVAERDRRLGLAILGANLTLDDELEPNYYDKAHDSLQSVFQQYQGLSAGRLYENLASRWESEIRRGLWYLQAVGITRLFASALLNIPYWLKGKIASDENSVGFLV